MAEEFRTPQSAVEAALQNWAGADNELRAPQSRIEKLLLAILGEDVTPDPPQSVNEELLTKILEQGGGGGSGDFELIYTTAKYKMNDVFSQEDETALRQANGKDYFAIGFYTIDGIEYNCPIYAIATSAINNSYTVEGNKGAGKNGPTRYYLQFVYNASSRQIKTLRGADMTSLVTATDTYFKIYKIK